MSGEEHSPTLAAHCRVVQEVRKEVLHHRHVRGVPPLDLLLASHQGEMQLDRSRGVHHEQSPTRPRTSCLAPHGNEVQDGRMLLRPRRVIQRGDLDLHSADEGIIVVDSGCDQTIINLSSFTVKTYTSLYYNVGGALSNCNKTRLELVNDAYTVANLADGSKICLCLHQVLLDSNPEQSEALVQPHQMRAHGVIVDDVPHRYKISSMIKNNPGVSRDQGDIYMGTKIATEGKLV